MVRLESSLNAGSKYDDGNFSMFGLAMAGGLLNLHKWMERLMHLDKAIFFLKPLGTSSFGLTDRLQFPPMHLDGWMVLPIFLLNLTSLITGSMLVNNPYASADFGLEQIRRVLLFLHSLQYAEDRLNTSVRIGFVGNRGTYESMDVDELSKGLLEGEVGLSYDIGYHVLWFIVSKVQFRVT